MGRSLFFFLIATAALCSCGRGHEPERTAERFLEGYLDCRFAEVEKMASPYVVELMHWRASQLTQTEIELLAEQTASVSVGEVMNLGDSVMIVALADNALNLGAPDEPGHIGEAKYRIGLRRQSKRWMVTSVNLAD